MYLILSFEGLFVSLHALTDRFPATRFTMQPNLLMRSWMMAYVYGAEYQAVVCHAGSDGEVAFRESLCPQYTSDRHDAKGLRTYHITGTCGGTKISRVACGRLGGEVAGADTGPLHITITSNTDSWQEGDLTNNRQLVSVDFNMQRTVTLPSNFLYGCTNLQRIDFTVLGDVEVLPNCFLYGCSSLREVDLCPFVNLREVGRHFLAVCSSIKSIDLTPLRAVEVVQYAFLHRCSGLEEVDLSPLVNLKRVEDFFLQGCSSIKSIDLTPFSAVEVLPNAFLSDCKSLRGVDLSPLANLREVGYNFLRGCSLIKSIDLAPLRAVEVLPYGFLCECSGIREVDLSPLANVVGECDEGRLEGCTNLKAIQTAPHQPACVVPESLRGLIVVRESNEV